jgi:hypothetical protein
LESEFHDLAYLWRSDVIHFSSVKTWDPEEELWGHVTNTVQKRERLGWEKVIIAQTALNFRDRDLGHRNSRILRHRNSQFEASNLTVSIRRRFISEKQINKYVDLSPGSKTAVQIKVSSYESNIEN